MQKREKLTEFDKAVRYVAASGTTYRVAADPVTNEMLLYIGSATVPQRYTQKGELSNNAQKIKSP